MGTIATMRLIMYLSIRDSFVRRILVQGGASISQDFVLSIAYAHSRVDGFDTKVARDKLQIRLFSSFHKHVLIEPSALPVAIFSQPSCRHAAGATRDDLLIVCHRWFEVSVIY
jgi:hypothetical protein